MSTERVQDKTGEQINDEDYVYTRYRGGTHQGRVDKVVTDEAGAHEEDVANPPKSDHAPIPKKMYPIASLPGKLRACGSGWLSATGSWLLPAYGIADQWVRGESSQHMRPRSFERRLGRLCTHRASVNVHNMRWPTLVACFIYGAFFSPALLCASPLHSGSSVSNPGHDLISVLSSAAEDPMVDGRVSDTVSEIQSRIAADESSQETRGDRVQLAFQKIEAIFTNRTNSTLLDFVHDMVASGLLPSKLLSFLNGYLDNTINSGLNKNPGLDGERIYPSRAAKDAPYSMPEEALRQAIHISSFSPSGRKGRKPVILVPGTAAPAGTSFYFNFGKLGSAIPEADVVWVNIPGASLGDVQINAEYIAYAINYLSALYQTKVTVIAWSQGGLNTQWAFKYWPSTREVVEDFVAVSPDFRGTMVSTLACPWLAGTLCTPALWQQGWDTKFVHTLRGLGGDSAYVPTTTVYSSFDEVVQPMSGEQASAILQDSHGVGVSNNHLQTICAHQPAGGIYTHEGILYNPLAWALTIDALTHAGPGDPSRLDIRKVCERSLPPQLSLDDMLGTEGLLLVSMSEVLRYTPKTFAEPDIIGYASRALGGEGRGIRRGRDLSM
ncbi:putative lipase [Aspergillus ibericus CBS 121593]|uniref:Alpha/beta-hydrolase n=1 Tax=Aspergillus ibericus CBS 121593 TaxID=1448316 RepID=A0A395GW15_9EURO|nr:alpha/beta-hydrolase [Aspergillus ibericus CBS 121593]RAK99726.1 alpha/beta-hydrolase [Aspergillus ibericus CBS 121593]